MRCTLDMVDNIISLFHEHPYYTQKLAYLIYITVESNIIVWQHVKDAYKFLLDNERPVFEGYISGLSVEQKKLLKALSVDETASLYPVG